MSDSLLALAVLAVVFLIGLTAYKFDKLQDEAALSERRAEIISILQKDRENRKVIEEVKSKKSEIVAKEKQRLERENDEYKRRLRALSTQNDPVGAYLNTDIPRDVTELLCGNVGAIKRGPDCSGTPGESAGTSETPSVRGKAK